MANDLNQCQFIGRLGADPEVRHMASGDAVANFRIACGWKSKEKEGAEWVPCTAFGKLAEICGQYLKKGSQVYVQGRFQTRKWQDKEGVDRYTTEVNLTAMQMLGGKPESSGEGKPKQQKEERKSADTFDSDDIPF